MRDGDAGGPTLLSGGGAAGAALRGLDWDTTGLGQPGEWAPALRSAVTLCLHAAVPMAVFWGDRLRFLFGDAWTPLLGDRAAGGGRESHAAGMMARPGEEVWPDIWHVIGPQLRQAMAGAGVSVEEAPIPLGGGSGPDTWWTYSFSPVLDSSGRRLGVLATVSDVSEQVLGRRHAEAIAELAERFARLHDAEEIVRVGCEAMGRTLRAARVGRGIVDEAAGTVTVSASWCDGLPNPDGVYGLAEFWAGWTAGPDLGAATVEDVSADERTAARAEMFREAGVAAFLTAPAAENGRVRMLTFVQSAMPRRWRAADLAFVRDVVSRGRAAADRARAEAALRESDIRNRHSVELSPLFMWTAQPDGRLDHLDERLTSRTGHPGLGGGWVDAVHPDDRAPSQAAWAAAVERGVRYDIEHRVMAAGEGYRWMRSRANPQRDEAGRVVKWYGSTEDVHDARQAAAALASSEARLRAMTDAVDQMIWSTLPDGTHDYYNQTWYDYTGLPAGSTDEAGWDASFHPDDRVRAGEVWRRSLETGEPYHIEYRLRHRSGSHRWVLGRAHPVRDGAGGIERWYGTCTDIQDIVEARDVLARSRAELERLVEETVADRERMWRLSTELMVIMRAGGVVTAINPAWERVLGWTAGDLVGGTLGHLLHQDDQDRLQWALGKLREGIPVELVELRLCGRDGAYRVLSWTAVPEGGMVHAIARDNTAERAASAQLEVAEEAMRQAQKMEAVGQLTGGIAHDFNNMLAVVIGSLDLLSRRLHPGDQRAARYVENAMEGARRAAALTHRLLAFSRQQKLSPVELDVPALLSGMIEWLGSSLGASIRLDVEFGPDVWPTLADHNQLENAILNLAVNARDAMPDGGLVRIAAANVTGAPVTVAPVTGTNMTGAPVTVAPVTGTNMTGAPGAGGPGPPPGDYVLITVSDTGEGIPPGVIGRVFDPFFTTKEVGRGTGLGLSQVYGFVTQSGGHVGLLSTPGAGTTVEIYLPRHYPIAELHAGQTDGAGGDALSDAPPWGAVLVVEDEPAVRRFSVEAVAALGYRVLEADHADAALALLDGAEDVRLLFTDVVMPDTNGLALAVEARRRRPGLKVLFASGCTREDDLGGAYPDGSVLPKPFTLDELAEAVRSALR